MLRLNKIVVKAYKIQTRHVERQVGTQKARGRHRQKTQKNKKAVQNRKPVVTACHRFSSDVGVGVTLTHAE